MTRKALKAYTIATGKGSLTPKAHDWIADLVRRFGDDRVSSAIAEEGVNGTEEGKLLGAVRARLTWQEATAGPGAAPRELNRGELLAIVRGGPEPGGPFLYSSRGLTSDEYAEVVRWAGDRRGHHVDHDQDDVLIDVQAGGRIRRTGDRYEYLATDEAQRPLGESQRPLGESQRPLGLP